MLLVCNLFRKVVCVMHNLHYSPGADPEMCQNDGVVCRGGDSCRSAARVGSEEKKSNKT